MLVGTTNARIWSPQRLQMLCCEYVDGAINSCVNYEYWQIHILCYLHSDTGRDDLTRPAKCTQNRRLKSGELRIKICEKKEESRDDNFLAKWLTEQVRVMQAGLEPHNLAILSRSVTGKGGSGRELKDSKSCVGSNWILTFSLTHSRLFCFVFGLTWNNHLRQLIILTRPKWRFVVQPAGSAAYQGSEDFGAPPAKIRPFTTSTGFFRIWPAANLLPLIWTSQYPLFLFSSAS
jgi:hypothetical protein